MVVPWMQKDSLAVKHSGYFHVRRFCVDACGRVDQHPDTKHVNPLEFWQFIPNHTLHSFAIIIIELQR